MTISNVMLALMLGVALMLTAGIGCAIAKRLDRDTADQDPQMPPPVSPEDQQMNEAYDRYWNALDEAALDGDTARYDRIKKVGWRKFGLTPSR